MKFNWSWLLLVAVLVVVAYKAGQMREGFFVSAYDGAGMAFNYILAFFGIIILIAAIVVFFYKSRV